MAQPANLFDTYDSVGNREDLTDIIYNIDPFDTPFMSMIGTGKAKATFHEWQTDSLAAASDNKQIEGDEATNTALTATTRLGNYTQISTKTCQVSGTEEEIDKAGRQKEMAYQLAKKGKELRMDMENAMVGINNARVAGNATTAREIASVTAWVTTDVNLGTSGASPTGDGTDGRTDGSTQSAIVEGDLSSLLETMYTNGSNASVLMAGAFNKRQISGFNGNADEVKHDNTDKRVINAVDVYVGDFHQLKVVPNRLQRARDVWVLDPSMWEVDFLRPFKQTPLAKTGDSERRMLLVEYTLKAKNELSSGLIADCTTS